MPSRSAGEPQPRPGPRIPEQSGEKHLPDERLANEESTLASSRRHGWYAAYVGRTYRVAVARALAARGEAAIILKTDLWNERLGGARDILGGLHRGSGARHVGIDLSFAVCAGARSRRAGLLAVQADIRALPFRAGSVDMVLDLSVLDHVAPTSIGAAIAEYHRVLRDSGVLLVIFWQRSAAVRFRLWLKRALMRSDKPGQYYFSRAAVRAEVRRVFAVAHEFAAGTLLVLPLPAVSAVLRILPSAVAGRAVEFLGEREARGWLRPALAHLSGLYGIIARCHDAVSAPEPLPGTALSHGLRHDGY